MIRLIARLLYTLLSIVQALIIFRIIIIFFSLKTSNFLVSKVMYYSSLFTNPFKGVLNNEIMNIAGFNIELTSILSLFIYLIVGFVIIEIIKAFSVD